MSKNSIKVEMNARLDETFIVQLIFGALIVVLTVVMMIGTYTFDFNLLFSIISGVLLIVYAIRYYRVKANLIVRIENSGKDACDETQARLNETFIVQLIFGVAMVVVPIIMMVAVYGFDFNLLFSIISGALLIFYTFRYYRYTIKLIDQIKKLT